MKFLDPIKTYLSQTRSATYGFLAALPLLGAYEFLILVVNPDEKAMIRIGADIWIKRMLASFGGKEHVTVGITILLLGIFIFIYERKKKIKIKLHYFYWMLLESIFYSIFCAFLVTKTVTYIINNTPFLVLLPLQVNSGDANAFWLQIALSIGAGLYEELFFRVMMVGAFYFIIKKFVSQKHTSYMLAAVPAALIFSSAHYVGAYGDVLTFPSFLFRFIFGLVLNFVYLLRGFGIAAWAHALYDILVTVVSQN